MKTHLIEWKRFVQKGPTCNRCDDTGGTLRDVIRTLNAGCGAKLARFRLKTTRLPARRIGEFNSILIDGRPLEQIVPGVTVTETDCRSCGELAGKPMSCRAVVIKGHTHNAVPADLIRSAICRVANCCGDDCDCGCGCGKPPRKSGTARREAVGALPCCDLKLARSRRPLKR